MRTHSAPLAALVLLAVTACGGAQQPADTAAPRPPRAGTQVPEPSLSQEGIDTSAAAQAANLVPRPAPRRPRDADQRFLRTLADHYEAMRAVVHDEMSTAASHAEHGNAVSLSAFDPILDAEQRSVLSLLDTLYDEEYTTAPVLVDGGSRRTEAATREATLTAHFTQGAEWISRTLPDIRNARVRTLATRLGTSLRAHRRSIEKGEPPR